MINILVPRTFHMVKKCSSLYHFGFSVQKRIFFSLLNYVCPEPDTILMLTFFLLWGFNSLFYLRLLLDKFAKYCNLITINSLEFKKT